MVAKCFRTIFGEKVSKPFHGVFPYSALRSLSFFMALYAPEMLRF